MPIRVCASAVFLVLALAGVGCWPRSAFGQEKSTGGSNLQRLSRQTGGSERCSNPVTDQLCSVQVASQRADNPYLPKSHARIARRRM
jgi:hypothetical protein